MTEADSEFVVLPVRAGALADAGNWVYAWVDQAGLVVYVGATGLAPHTRVWLHLHDADPDVGRMAARFGRLAESELDVLAMSVRDEVSRADVRDALGFDLPTRVCSRTTRSRITCSFRSTRVRRPWSSPSASSPACGRT